MCVFNNTLVSKVFCYFIEVSDCLCCLKVTSHKFLSVGHPRSGLAWFSLFIPEKCFLEECQVLVISGLGAAFAQTPLVPKPF